MSYILDALKKSERDRSLGHVPTLNTVHSYPKVPASRRWLWLALALLILLILIGGVIYGVMFWGQGHVFRSSGESSPSSLPEARGVVEPQKPFVQAVTGPAVTDAAPGKKEVNTPPAAKPPSSRSAMTAQTLQSYPTIDDLDDGMRQRLTDIVVNVVSYAEQPSRRFVMINQKIYHQGQNVNAQLKVVEIKPDGAILRFQGREFLAVP